MAVKNTDNCSMFEIVQLVTLDFWNFSFQQIDSSEQTKGEILLS